MNRAQPAIARCAYAIELVRDLDDALRLLESATQRASPFQDQLWLTTWFRTVGQHHDVRPLLIRIRDRGCGRLAMILPLIELEEGGRKVIEFADLGVTDYNAPLLGPASPRGATAMRQLWSSLKRALPPADAIRLAKMPSRIDGEPNPFTQLAACHRSSLNANVLTIAAHDGFRRELKRLRCKELDRCWRVFRRLGGTEFRHVTDLDQALECLCLMEKQQGERIKGLGLPYALSRPKVGAFYRDLIIEGLASGYVVMTVLLAGETVVAALLGLRGGSTFATLRISNAGQSWKRSSPGQLVIARTIEHMCAQGCTSFDFTIGDYEFKRRLGCKRTALIELTEALSWRGVLLASKAAVKGHLRRHPKLAGGLRQLLRREKARRG